MLWLRRHPASPSSTRAAHGAREWPRGSECNIGNVLHLRFADGAEAVCWATLLGKDRDSLKPPRPARRDLAFFPDLTSHLDVCATHCLQGQDHLTPAAQPPISSGARALRWFPGSGMRSLAMAAIYGALLWRVHQALRIALTLAQSSRMAGPFS